MTIARDFPSISRCVSLLLALGLASLAGCGGSVADPVPTQQSQQQQQPTQMPSGGTPQTNQPTQGSSPPAQPSQPSQPDPNALAGSFGYESPPNVYDSATVSATSSAASYDFECMQGSSGPIVPDASGAFSVQGSLVSTGGSITSYSNVTFFGTVSGDSIVLNASWPLPATEGAPAQTETYGPVTVTKGVVPDRFPGCI